MMATRAQILKLGERIEALASLQAASIHGKAAVILVDGCSEAEAAERHYLTHPGDRGSQNIPARRLSLSSLKDQAMASKSQIATISKRIEALVAAQNQSTRVIVVFDEAEMQAVRCREGDRASSFTFIVTGVPRGRGRMANWLKRKQETGEDIDTYLV
jgi:hypothetical protein